jgi:nucleoside-diphosphate-sugar epimerase
MDRRASLWPGLPARGTTARATHEVAGGRHALAQPIDIDAAEIYNLACPASPKQYQEDPVKTVRTNVIGAMNMLELARRCDARILQASTSDVYGDPLLHPQNESYWGNVNPVGPRSCYDEGKRCAETLFADYRRQFGLDTRIERIFNTNFTIFDDQSLLARCDEISRKIHDHIIGNYRKFVAWNGPFDQFIYIDSDSVVTLDVSFAYEFLEDHAFVFSHSDAPYLKRFVWKKSIDAAGVLTQEQISTRRMKNFAEVVRAIGKNARRPIAPHRIACAACHRRRRRDTDSLEPPFTRIECHALSIRLSECMAEETSIDAAPGSARKRFARRPAVRATRMLCCAQSSRRTRA